MSKVRPPVRPQPEPELPLPEVKNRPHHKLRHRRLTATIWRDMTAKGPIYNVTISRSYQDAESKWHDTGSFGYDDLMNVAKLLMDAHSVITMERMNEQRTATPA